MVLEHDRPRLRRNVGADVLVDAEGAMNELNEQLWFLGSCLIIDFAICGLLLWSISRRLVEILTELRRVK